MATSVTAILEVYVVSVLGDDGQRKVWSSCGSTHCTCQLTILSMSVLECGFI